VGEQAKRLNADTEYVDRLGAFLAVYSKLSSKDKEDVVNLILEKYFGKEEI